MKAGNKKGKPISSPFPNEGRNILLEMKVDAYLEHVVADFSVVAMEFVLADKPFVSKVDGQVWCDFEIHSGYKLGCEECVIVIQ